MIKIEDIKNKAENEKVTFNALISKISERTKKDNNKYMVIKLQDDTDSLKFPVWDTNALNGFEVGDILNVKGLVSIYEHQVQIKDIELEKINDDKLHYVPHYKIMHKDIIFLNEVIESITNERYLDFVETAIGIRGHALGSPGLIKRWENFTTAPAAEYNHHNKLGGLFLHTIGVIKNVKSIISNYSNEIINKVIDKEKLLIKAILHDYMKTEEYEYKDVIRRKNIKADHLIMGYSHVRDVNKELGNILTDEEVDDIGYGILSHHGEFGGYKPRTLEDNIVYNADYMDYIVMKEFEGNF